MTTGLTDAFATIKQRRAVDKSKALELYRRFVDVVADGKPISVADADKISNALETLQLEQEHFEGDVEAKREWLANCAVLEGFDEAQAAIHEEEKKQNFLAKKLRQDLREAELAARNHESLARRRIEEKRSLNDFKRLNNRLFADVSIALQAKDPAVTFERMARMRSDANDASFPSHALMPQARSGI